jgi:ribosome-associated toxin RatA of RatAB toxin-antitoxin module
MKMFIKALFTFFLAVGFLIVEAMAYNTFHPEADETLNEGKVWAITTFKKGDIRAKTAFRAWIPYPAEKVWMVLIDTNSYHKIHSDYRDSRSLDKNQFELVAQKKPTSARAFYEMVGEQIFGSYHGRRKGRVWTSYVFQRFNFPWPLKDRWNMMKVKNVESRAHKGEYRYEYKSYAGNFKDLRGYWELIPVPGKPGYTEFRGEYKADPGIAVPKFLAKKIFRASMRRSVKNYIKVLSSLKEGKKK